MKLSPTPATAEDAIKLVVFNLRHGNNLGDQLIAECMERELAIFGVPLKVQTEDLGGRDAPSSGAQRRLAFVVLDRLPKWLRLIVAEMVLNRLATRRLRPKWRKATADVGAIIIGGGGIFADSDLNFPIKIATVLQVAKERGIPVAVHAVGVSRTWSGRGERILGRALAEVRLIQATARDEASIGFWAEHTKRFGVPAATFAYDPALLTARHFAGGAAPTGRPARIGLCITSPAALRYHGTLKIHADELIGQYTELVGALRSNGADVALFTTGLPEDAQFMLQVGARVGAQVDLTEQFITAAQMAFFISGCNLVISHRLHAIICAYAFGIPGIAFAWDEKMVGQCALLGMSARLFDLSLTPASTIAECGIASMAAGIDATKQQALIQSASRDLRQVAEALMGTRRAV